MRTRGKQLWVASVVLALASCAAATGRPAVPAWGERLMGDGTGSFRLSLAVIVHKASKRAYLSRRGKGIEAMDLVTGRTLWTSDAADRPLAASGGLLVAQEVAAMKAPYALRVAVLDTNDRGKVLVRFDPVALPSLVRPRPWNNGAMFEYDAGARIEGEQVLVWWRMRTRAYPSPIKGGTGGGANRFERGLVRYDLATGAVLETETWSKPAPRWKPPAALREVMRALMIVGETGAHLRTTREISGVVRDRRDDREVFILRRWDVRTAAVLGEVALTPEGEDEVRNRTLVARFSADGEHLLLTRLSGFRKTSEYEFAVYETDGDLVERWVYEGSYPYPWPFLVVGDRLMFVAREGPIHTPDEDAYLVGLGIEGAVERWSRPLRVVKGHGMPAAVRPGGRPQLASLPSVHP